MDDLGGGGKNTSIFGNTHTLFKVCCLAKKENTTELQIKSNLQLNNFDLSIFPSLAVSPRCIGVVLNAKSSDHFINKLLLTTWLHLFGLTNSI